MTGLGIGIGVGVGGNIGNAGDGSALFLNFLAGSLDSRITFTRGSTAYRVNASGILESIAINTPRFDYNPTTLQQRGLLVEEGRTNLALRSAEFDNAAWGKANLTVTANTATAPDGTVTAEKLVEAATSSQHILIQTYTKAASALPYTFTCWAKRAERHIQLVLYDTAGANGISASFDLVNGVANAPGAFGAGWTGGSSRIEAYPNGWYRCILRATTTAATDLGSDLKPVNDAFVSNYAGDGTSGVLAWGAQVEQADFETSYIPTAGASANRSSDIPVLTGANFSSWFNATEGTFLGIATSAPLPSPAAPQYVSFASDGTLNERLLLRRSGTGNAQASVVHLGVFEQDYSPSVWGNLTQGRLALAYKLNDSNGSFNGAIGTTDVTCTMPTGLTQLNIGGDFGGNRWNGWVESIKYWNTRLADAALQSLTA